MKKTSPVLLAMLALSACATQSAQQKPEPVALPPATVAPEQAAALPLCPPREPYAPAPPPPSTQPALPALPETVTPPIRVGNAFTVRGAIHHLRSRVHLEEVNGKPLTIVGYIVKTNYSLAPKCAVHRVGKADPVDCRAPVPSFFIADEKAETEAMIEVMGWASNFAQIYTLMDMIDHAPQTKEPVEVQWIDEFWGNALPNPLPNVGAKVSVSGTYGITFTKASSGAAADPKHGIMTAEKIDYIERPREKASLPGMKRK